MGLPAELFGGRGAGEVAESLRCCGRFSPCRWQTRADLCNKLPLMDVIENGALLEALQKLNERERQIFLARTLEEEDFETLGVKFELSYKGAAALYYRTIQKIRKSIEGGDKR